MEQAVEAPGSSLGVTCRLKNQGARSRVWKTFAMEPFHDHHHVAPTATWTYRLYIENLEYKGSIQSLYREYKEKL